MNIITARLKGMLAAYPQFPADMFCFDLEDGTPPQGKVAAREGIAETLRNVLDPANRERLLRVNGLDTPWGYGDLAAAASLPISSVLLPKVEGAAMVRQAEAILAAEGAPRSDHLPQDTALIPTRPLAGSAI